MKFVGSVCVAAVALMANSANGFQVVSRTTFRTSSSTGLRMSSSYEEQLKAYATKPPPKPATAEPVNGTSEKYPLANANPFMNAQKAGPIQVAPPPPPVAQPSPVVIQTESPKDGLGPAGIVFLGMPLWLLLAYNVFFGGSPSTVSSPSEMSLPSNVITNMAPSAAKPSGVVVLSQPITKAEVRDLFQLWNSALQTLDPATVAKRYAKDGVLLPTLSDVPRTDFNGIKDYFVGFLKKKPVGKILEGEIFVGNNWAQDAGIYEFTFEDGSKVKARYSFVYAFEDGQWMISHHHSSLMPEEVVRPAKITESEVRGLFNLWNNALATGDPQQVAARYSKDAVLLPTLSDSARYTNDRIADYFVGFLKKKPQGEILEGNVKIGPNWAQDAGIYEFTFEDGSKTRGRYSFVYTYENGKWMISNHHSSIMPEPAVAAMKKAAAMAPAPAPAVAAAPAVVEKVVAAAPAPAAPVVVAAAPVAAEKVVAAAPAAPAADEKVVAVAPAAPAAAEKVVAAAPVAPAAAEKVVAAAPVAPVAAEKVVAAAPVAPVAAEKVVVAAAPAAPAAAEKVVAAAPAVVEKAPVVVASAETAPTVANPSN